MDIVDRLAVAGASSFAGEWPQSLLREAATEIRRLRSAASSDRDGRALADVAAERKRQIEAEGWTAEHDDSHDEGDLAHAAACYAIGHRPMIVNNRSGNHGLWPWADKWWKLKDRRYDLVRAAALIIAEIERADRAALKTASSSGGTDG